MNTVLTSNLGVPVSLFSGEAHREVGNGVFSFKEGNLAGDSDLEVNVDDAARLSAAKFLYDAGNQRTRKYYFSKNSKFSIMRIYLYK